jgi:hypothetical protein
MAVSKRTLVVLAAGMWYIGGVMLLIKGSILLMQARSMEPGLPWPWLAAVVGTLIGIFKAKNRFYRACEKNITRIARLQEPKVWHVFRPIFYLALALMMSGGVALSHLAQGQYYLLILVGILELSISVALFGSSRVFWTTLPKMPS